MLKQLIIFGVVCVTLSYSVDCIRYIYCHSEDDKSPYVYSKEIDALYGITKQNITRNINYSEVFQASIAPLVISLYSVAVPLFAMILMESKNEELRNARSRSYK